MTIVERSNAAVETRGLILVSPQPGRDAPPIAELHANFGEHDVEVCAPEEISHRTATAQRQRRPFVAVTGGDGATRRAAEVLAGGQVALLPIPTTDDSMFASRLGIATIDDAILAAKHNQSVAIDIGRVNGRIFVNRSSVGMYPHTTGEAIIRQLRAPRNLTVTLDGRGRRAWLALVTNGCESLHDGVLDVRVVRADHHLARARQLASAFLPGRAPRPVTDRRTCPHITLDTRGHSRIEVALDGDIESMTAPLRYEAVQAGLLVLSPDPLA
jgi:diacylglycerol kinase family enzyme